MVNHAKHITHACTLTHTNTHTLPAREFGRCKNVHIQTIITMGLRIIGPMSAAQHEQLE